MLREVQTTEAGPENHQANGRLHIFIASAFRNTSSPHLWQFLKQFL